MRGSASFYIVFYDRTRSEFPQVWHIHGLASETEDSARDHLKRWLPSADFVGVIVVPDEKENQ